MSIWTMPPGLSVRAGCSRTPGATVWGKWPAVGLLDRAGKIIDVSGLALVTAIDDCPPIAGGEGSVVTARFVTVRWGFDPSVKLQHFLPHGSQPHATVG